MNSVADHQSRVMMDNGDWKLDTHTFQLLNRAMGPLKWDLFATLWNRQTRLFYSWKPQPEAQGSDALIQDWDQEGNYAFPPWILIPRVISKIKREKIQVCLVTPMFTSKTWFCSLMQLSIQRPILLDMLNNTLTDAQNNTHPLLLQKKLQLVGWKLSGKKQKLFRERCQQQSGFTTMPCILSILCSRRKIILSALPKKC